MPTNLMLISCLLVLLAGCESRSDTETGGNWTQSPHDVARAASAPVTSVIERVSDPSQVCMVNDQFMGRAQIPVDVDGSVYYGCCPMCEGRLARDPAVRFGLDPISNQPVDKATAIIGRDPSGSVLYFSSEENFATYVERAARTPSR